MEENLIANPVSLRQRNFSEVLRYLAQHYPEISFGISFSKGEWTSFASKDGKNVLSLPGDKFETMISIVVAAVINSDPDTQPLG